MTSLDDLDKLDSLKKEFSLHLSSTFEHPYNPVCLCLEQGAYINGLFMAGARWDDDNMCIEDSFPKARLCTGTESNMKQQFTASKRVKSSKVSQFEAFEVNHTYEIV